MNDLLVGWQTPRTPAPLNPPSDDIPPALARVLPEFPHDGHMPGLAHLSAAVQALHTSQANLQHYFVENKVRHY